MALQSIKWIGSSDGTPANIVAVAEGTSETFLKGDLVIYDLSENGLVALANTSGVPTAQTFYGIAQEDASGTAGTSIDVLIPRSGDKFSAALASSETTTVAPDQDNRGQLAGLIKMDSSNDSVYAVDEGTTTWVKVLEVHRQDIELRGGNPADATTPTMSAGDRVVFQFQEDVLAAAGAQA